MIFIQFIVFKHIVVDNRIKTLQEAQQNHSLVILVKTESLQETTKVDKVFAAECVRKLKKVAGGHCRRLTIKQATMIYATDRNIADSFSR